MFIQDGPTSRLNQSNQLCFKTWEHKRWIEWGYDNEFTVKPVFMVA